MKTPKKQRNVWQTPIRFLITPLFLLPLAASLGCTTYCLRTQTTKSVSSGQGEPIQKLEHPIGKDQQGTIATDIEFLNVWGRIVLQGTPCLVFTYEDPGAALSGKGDFVTDPITVEQAKQVVERPILTVRFPLGFHSYQFRPLSQDEITSLNLPAKPAWLKYYGPQGKIGRPWRNDPSLVGKFHLGYPNDIQAMFFFPEPGKTEVMWVRLQDVDRQINGYIGTLLNQPYTPSTLSKGIRVAIRVTTGVDYPVYISKITRRNLQEWEAACSVCGFDLVFIQISDYIESTFRHGLENGKPFMFTMRCPVCSQTMFVKKKEKEKAKKLINMRSITAEVLQNNNQFFRRENYEVARYETLPCF